MEQQIQKLETERFLRALDDAMQENRPLLSAYEKLSNDAPSAAYTQYYDVSIEHMKKPGGFWLFKDLADNPQHAALFPADVTSKLKEGEARGNLDTTIHDLLTHF